MFCLLQRAGQHFQVFVGQSHGLAFHRLPAPLLGRRVWRGFGGGKQSQAPNVGMLVPRYDGQEWGWLCRL